METVSFYAEAAIIIHWKCQGVPDFKYTENIFIELIGKICIKPPCRTFDANLYTRHYEIVHDAPGTYLVVKSCSLIKMPPGLAAVASAASSDGVAV